MIVVDPGCTVIPVADQLADNLSALTNAAEPLPPSVSDHVTSESDMLSEATPWSVATPATTELVVIETRGGTGSSVRRRRRSAWLMVSWSEMAEATAEGSLPLVPPPHAAKVAANNTDSVRGIER